MELHCANSRLHTVSGRRVPHSSPFFVPSVQGRCCSCRMALGERWSYELSSGSRVGDGTGRPRHAVPVCLASLCRCKRCRGRDIAAGAHDLHMCLDSELAELAPEQSPLAVCDRVCADVWVRARRNVACREQLHLTLPPFPLPTSDAALGSSSPSCAAASAPARWTRQSAWGRPGQQIIARRNLLRR
jgi:hypothetical protein